MSEQAELAAGFLALHEQERPLLLANAWDVGSAKLLASVGFQALATTSSGYAATLGRLDYSLTRDEALAHASALVAATAVPISADFENCFAEDAAGVGETVRMAIATGLAPMSTPGISIVAPHAASAPPAPPASGVHSSPTASP
jgi:2-methylisocitrate lyase-like PEP mutase family enzyme